MLKNDLDVAEKLLKTHLKQAPTDVPAIRMLAEVAVRCGRYEDAGHLLRRCLELAPGFAAARYNYAVLLHRRNDPAAALAEIERLLAVDPRSPELPQPARGDPEPGRRVRAFERDLRATARGIPEATPRSG